MPEKKDAYKDLQERELYILTEFFKLLGNLVRQRRDGKMIFYTLVDDHVRMVIEKGTEHVLLR